MLGRSDRAENIVENQNDKCPSCSDISPGCG